MMQVGLKFGPLLGRSWVDFGAKLSPSWDQVGTRIWKIGVPRRCQKIIENLVTQWYASRPGSWPLKTNNTTAQEHQGDDAALELSPVGPKVWGRIYVDLRLRLVQILCLLSSSFPPPFHPASQICTTCGKNFYFQFRQFVAISSLVILRRADYKHSSSDLPSKGFPELVSKNSFERCI